MLDILVVSLLLTILYAVLKRCIEAQKRRFEEYCKKQEGHDSGGAKQTPQETAQDSEAAQCAAREGASLERKITGSWTRSRTEDGRIQVRPSLQSANRTKRW
jgi:type II secretory pathway component PulM